MHYDSLQSSPKDGYGTGELPFIKQQQFRHLFRQRLNFCAIVISLFVPWAIYAGMFWVMCFNLRYSNPSLCYFIVVCCLALVLLFGLFAWRAFKQKEHHDPRWEPTWLLFLFLTSLLAWLWGVFSGNLNYDWNMGMYYDVTNLSTYHEVNPAQLTGQMLMDAGRLVFDNTTRLDFSKSRSFTTVDTYCVVPITTGKEKLPYYDFWAVGMNCCPSKSGARFACGEYDNPQARAGVREARDSELNYFRLAVEQAEPAYKIRSLHPIFFHWVADPIAEINAYLDRGAKAYLLGPFAGSGSSSFMGSFPILGVFTYFFVQLLLVVGATYCFSQFKLLY